MVETDPFLGALRSEKCPGAGTPERGCFDGNSMTRFAPGRENGHDGRTDLEPRTRRALEEPLSVLTAAFNPCR